MHETVDGRERHSLVGEDFAPFAEGLVGGDARRTQQPKDLDAVVWVGKEGPDPQFPNKSPRAPVRDRFCGR